MEDLKYQILEKINHINLYHRRTFAALRRKYWFNVAFGTIFLFFGIFSIFDIVKLFIEKPKYIDLSLIGTGAFLITYYLWALTWKWLSFPVKNIDGMTNLELNDYLNYVSKYEEEELKGGSEVIAFAFSLPLFFLFMVTYIGLLKYNKTGQFQILSLKMTDKDILFHALPLIYLLVIFIAQIIGTPITTKKYQKEKMKLTNKFIFSFITNFDNSPINPINNPSV